MPNSEYEVPLSLSNVCGGKLDMEFQEKYQAAMATLKEGQKATITINLELSRVKGTSTMVNVGYKLTPKFPAVGDNSVCQIDGDGKLLTEKPVKDQIKVVSMFENKGAAINE